MERNRDIIIERCCSSDEKGLFLSLPVSYLHTFIDDNNRINLSIIGNIANLANINFWIDYDRDCSAFIDKKTNNRVKKITLFSYVFVENLGPVTCGLTLVADHEMDMIHFYDTFYCLFADLEKGEINKYSFASWNLINVLGNIKEIPNENKDDNRFVITVDPYTDLITEVISPNDCCFTTYKTLVFSNTDSKIMALKDKITTVDELVGNYLYKNNEFVFITSDVMESTPLKEINQIRQEIIGIREIQTTITKDAIYDRVFNQYESIELIQKEKQEKDLLLSEKIKSIQERQMYLYNKRREIVINKIEEIAAARTYKYHTSVCLLIKDENEFLEEWLDNYWNIGVEHFYIYDNKSKTPILETLKSIKNGFYIDKCDVVLFTEYTHMQYECYEHCLMHFGKDSKWIGFLDTDEFVEFTDGTQDIKEFLNGEEFQNKCAVWIPWQIYGANGHIEKPQGGMRKNYTTPSIDPFGLWGKIFVRTDYVKKVYVHAADSLYNCYDSVEQMGAHLAGRLYGKITEYAKKGYDIYPRVKINHYVTRSFKDWCEKMARGSSDPNFKRKFNIFFKYNPDLAYLKNDEAVKEMINGTQVYI